MQTHFFRLCPQIHVTFQPLGALDGDCWIWDSDAINTSFLTLIRPGGEWSLSEWFILGAKFFLINEAE